jgi:AmiR/NasT family two-component response regulator
VATHTALTLDSVRHHRHLRSSLGSRDIIGQTKGILMERFAVDADSAFALLTSLAEKSQQPVVVVAKQLLDERSRAEKRT